MKKFYGTLLILTASLMFTGCVTQGRFNRMRSDYQESQMLLTESRARATSLEDQLAEARRNNAELRANLADMQNSLNKSLAQSTQGSVNIAKLVNEINASNRFIQHLIQTKNRADSLNLVMVTNLTRSLTREEMQNLDIQVLQGVVYISLSDRMLYRSGSFEISNEAGQILGKIAKIILDYKEYNVLVEGNTDTDPISRPNIRNNWDLSTLRASSVVQSLQNNYGVNPIRLTAAGRGEYNPIATNSTPEGRALNRRTQIILTPTLNQFMELIEQAPANLINPAQ